MSWIKVVTTLPRSAKIRQLARSLGCKRHTALGLAIDWFCWLDAQTTDGNTGLYPEDVDDELGFRGAASALELIGWTSRDDEGCVVALGFDEHNGATAKDRAQSARRKSLSRSRQEICHTASVTCVTPQALPREEKRREDKNIEGGGSNALAPTSAAADGLPGRQAAPASFDDVGFGDFVAAVCQATPAAKRMRVLPADVEAAAKAAYETIGGLSSADAELLKAFYAAKLTDNTKFWRPTGLSRLFADLGDVLAHAERWAKWKGWKAKGSKSLAAPAPTQGRKMTEEEEEALRQANLKDIARTMAVPLHEQVRLANQSDK